MRLFIAINLSDEMKNTLISAQNTMYDRGIRGNFTSEENMHLTLAFIGEYPDADLVLDALSTVSFTPFDITLEGIGCFGDLWWAGLKESVPLMSVVRRIRRALAESEIPFDRKRFSPHITLIRKASGKMWSKRKLGTKSTLWTLCLSICDATLVDPLGLIPPREAGISFTR